MNMKIRKAITTDAESLFEMNELFNGKSCTSIKLLKKSLEGNKQEEVFVVIKDKINIGFCCIQLFKSICYSRHYAEITELFIREEYRKCGIASFLIKFVEEYYKDKNIGGYQLFTGGNNVIAQRFYEKCGYIKTDEIMYRKRLK